MNCPSQLVHSMYADGALAADEAAALEQHAAACAACRTLVAALRHESAALRAALRADERLPIPRFERPFRLRDVAALVIGAGIVGGFATAFWNASAAAIPNGLRWLNPFRPGELAELAIGLVTFIVSEGNAMWTATLDFVAAALLLALAIWIASSTIRKRTLGAGAALALAIIMALPSVGHALERRQGDLVAVAAGETIDDSLLATGDTIAIDGDVNGDLLAFGRSVTVRGSVAGNLVTGAETIDIEGSVGGSVIGGGRAVSLLRARVAGNLYGAGRDVDVGAGAEILGNAIAFGENVGVDGRVGADLFGFASALTIGGNVGGDVEGFAGSINLLPSARIAGNVTAHVDGRGDINVATGAGVGGRVDERLVPREERRNRYLTVGFYVRQVVRLGAAFLTGLVLLWAVPALREASLPNAATVLRSGAIGLAAAVTLPVAALLLCVTIVGLPIGVFVFVLGAIGLYFAKAVLAQIIGRAVFQTPDSPPHYAATLLSGLVIIIVAINLPLVGGIANLLLTLVGFGVIVTLLLARFSGRSTF